MKHKDGTNLARGTARSSWGEDGRLSRANQWRHYVPFMWDYLSFIRGNQKKLTAAAGLSLTLDGVGLDDGVNLGAPGLNGATPARSSHNRRGEDGFI